MTKRIFYGDEARAQVLGGAKVVFDLVKVTYGPKAGDVGIDKAYGGPTITHDGVTVVESIDELELTPETSGYKIGIELVQRASMRLNKEAGDGTTSVVILTYSLMEEANRMIVAGHNSQDLRRQLKAAADVVLSALKDRVEVIDDMPERIVNVATISAGDETIGKLVADVMNKVGTDGVVTVEASQESLELSADIVEGFRIDRGYVSPFFVTDIARQEAVFENPPIIICDRRINSPNEFVPIMERLASMNRRDFVLIADDVDIDALRWLAVERRNGLRPLVIAAPSFGDRRKDILQDIATLTGAEVVSELSGITFSTAKFGSARRVIAKSDETTIIEGSGEPKTITERLNTLKTQSETATTEFDTEFYTKRRAALSGKVAVIRVGGATETEIDEKKYRVDDAVAATQAALAEGIVAGGGVTLVNLASVIANRPDPGSQILARALRKPFLQLMANAGLNGEALLHQIEEDEDGMGVDVNNPGELIPVIESGVIDPVKVTREVISSAVSIASTAANMGALVIDLDNDQT